MQTLADYLANGLRLISVGLNPSLPSIKHGFYFANPRNRFWKALNGSKLISKTIHPAPGIEQTLLKQEKIGFTDVVKRPTANASKLRAKDYKEWSPVLETKILNHQPKVVWFHGKLAYENFLRHTHYGKNKCDWGLQQQQFGKSLVFVSPNPSPANAAYSLDDLIYWYNALAKLLNKS